MHIPGKLEYTKRNPAHRFFRRWAAQRKADGKTKLLTLQLPHAQKVAQIAGNAIRISAWKLSCQ